MAAAELAGYTLAQEAALKRTLRDIADGHLTLWIDRDDYDPQTGQVVDNPRVYPDRAPAAGTPDAGGAWWLPLVQAGWIKPHRAGNHLYYRAEFRP